MQEMKKGAAHSQKRRIYSSYRALEDFKEAKADFEKCRSMNVGAEKIIEAKKNLFLAAEVLAELAQKNNLEKKSRLAIDFYKMQIGMTNLCVKTCEYFMMPVALYLSFRLRGTEDGVEVARIGLAVTASSFILRAIGIRFENKRMKEQYDKLDALHEAANIARSRNLED